MKKNHDHATGLHKCNSWHGYMAAGIIAISIIGVIMISGCGPSEPGQEEKLKIAPKKETLSEYPDAVVSEYPDAEVIQEVNADFDWKKMYIDYLNDKAGDLSAGYVGAGLVYIDDDDVPEMIIPGNCEASGNIMLTCSSKGIDESISSRLGISFIEKNNKLMNSDGHMGYYYDTLFSIVDGKWIVSQDGYYGGAIDDSENYEEAFTYTWNGETVSALQYRNKLDDCYDESEAVVIDNYNLKTFAEMKSMLAAPEFELAKTAPRYRTDSTDIHRYEFFLEDTPWYTASYEASDKGGYLVRINSREEFEYISDLIRENDLGQNVFWTAGSRDIGFESHYRWSLEDYTHESAMLDEDPEFADMWMEGEPSYYGVNADGSTCAEEYVVIFYLKSKDKFVLNDVPEDISSFYPGRVGYIVEYED